MTVEHCIKIFEIAAWPMITLVAIGLFFKQLLRLIKILLHRIESGAEFSTPWANFGELPTTVKEPRDNNPITENNMALVHSSWRYPKKDREFARIMYCFHVIVQAPEKVLESIEYVKYSLHPSYKKNNQPVVDDRKSQFKLKELAWGESIVKAEVKIRKQDEPVLLSRYINLSESGPRIP